MEIVILLVLVFIGYGYLQSKTKPSKGRMTSSKKPAETYNVSKLTSDMLQPTDAEVKTNDAVKFFREFMLKTGTLDKDEISDHTQMFREEMREHAEALREDLASSKEDLAEYKETLKELKAGLKHADEEEKEDIEAEIEDTEIEIEDTKSEIEETRAELAAYQKDKRAFLINYVNRQYMRS